MTSLLALAISACGGASRSLAVSPGMPGTGGATPPSRMEESTAVGQLEAAGAIPAEPSPPSAPPSASAPVNAAVATPAAAAATQDAELARAKQMVDIEARLRVEVERVDEAAARLRKIAAESGGRIANEITTADTAESARAEFTLRVPVGKADSVFVAVDALGVTRARSVTARDIGKEYYDSVLRLRNLGVTRERLEDVLKHASEVKDILTIEAELSRVRGEMEQIEGQLRYLRDRAAFATIYVTLFVRPTAQPVAPVIVKPEAKFFPGLRGGYLLDVHGDGSTAGYYGAGLSVGVSRQFDLRLDGYRRLDHAEGALNAFAATLGGRFYSEYLGGGTRKFLDPYLGLRGGYSRFEAHHEIAAGITLGLEIWKTETVRLDLGVDGLVLFGSAAGAHSALAPSLGLDVAF